jgi:hypothetical protein
MDPELPSRQAKREDAGKVALLIPGWTLGVLVIRLDSSCSEKAGDEGSEYAEHQFG